jgi:glycosyltransferase involved in cell wall biosynthesis
METAKFGFDCSYVWQSDIGYNLAGARNQGILKSNAKRCLFTDNDIWFSPRTVEFHSKIHPNNIGVSTMHWLNKPFSQRLLDETTEVPSGQEFMLRKNLQAREMRGNINIACPDNCWGGAVSYSSALLRHAGGFDEAGFLNKYGFEDIDLAWRLMRSPLGTPGGGRAGYEVAGESIGFHVWHPFGDYRHEVPGNVVGGKRINSGYYNKAHYGPLKGRV